MFAKHLKRADGKIFALARFIVNIRRLLLKIVRGRFDGQENDYVVPMYTYIYSHRYATNSCQMVDID